MKKPSAVPMPSPCPSRPWEVAELFSEYLGPKSLAIATCVSKSWNIIFSSDHLWKPICSSHFPSSLQLMVTGADPSSSLRPRRLFALLRAASMRRHVKPTPSISLCQLIFTFDIFRGATAQTLLSLAMPGGELKEAADGTFRFHVKVGHPNCCVDLGEELREVWMVVMKGWEGAFMMMDVKGMGSETATKTELWYSVNLPNVRLPGCCAEAEGLLRSEVSMELSDLHSGDGGEEEEGTLRKVIKRVTLGLMSTAAWRYVTVDDGLLFLQYYLLPDIRQAVILA